MTGDKDEVLARVRSLVHHGIISRDELLALAPVGASASTHKESRLAEILYYLGGAIVCLGVVVLLGQQWEVLPKAAKILSTFGAAIAAYVVAILLSHQGAMEKVARAFFLISAVLLPIGLTVILETNGYDVAAAGIQTLIAGLCLAVFLGSFILFRRTVLLIFSILFAVGFLYAYTGYLTGGKPVFEEPTFTEYRTLAVGLALMMLGYGLRGGPHHSFVGTLYGLGSLAFLGSALALSGFKPDQSVGWELAFPVLVFGVIFLSVQLKSRTFLWFGSLFFMGYILKLTAEYFSDSLGWPLALVIAGLALIAVGYGMVSLRRTYFTSVTH